jgi:hypothetical protein
MSPLTLEGFDLESTPPAMHAQGLVSKADLCRILGLKPNSVWHALRRVNAPFRHVKVGRISFYELRPILADYAAGQDPTRPKADQ